jgi:DNA polymerase-3 subunit epsilon
MFWGFFSRRALRRAAPGFSGAGAARPVAEAAPANYAAAWKELPRESLFLDVETTGLGFADRLVSIGAVRLTTAPVDIRTLHLIFNPERRCHPRATAVHGFDRATLKRQQPFAPYAGAVSRYLARADRLVAHHAAFDLRFVNAELLANGAPGIRTPTVCTMLTYRARGEGPASLEAIAARLGLARRSGLHSAVEDAWLTMQIYLWMHDCPWRLDFSSVDAEIANFVAAPAPRPRGRPRKIAPAAAV